MANKKITDLNEATTISGTDWLVMVDVANDETKKIHANQVGGNIPIQDTAPLDPEEDDLWIDTSDDNRLKYFNGISWVGVSDNITGDTLPIGAIVPYGSATAPTNWLVCDGSAVSRTIYAELFSAIGTSFGAGDGNTTFNLPNLKGRVAVGQDTSDSDFNDIGETGGSKYIQDHYHEYKFGSAAGGDGSGLAYSSTTGTQPNKAAITNVKGALTGNSGNLQPYMVTNYIIKAKQTAGLVGAVSDSYSASHTDTYSCEYINGVESNLDTKINTLAKSVAFNNEWRIAYKPSAGNFVTTIPINNPGKKSVSFSTGFTIEIYMNGWQTCTFNTAYYLETELCIRIILPSDITLTDGNVYLIRMKGTVTVND